MEWCDQEWVLRSVELLLGPAHDVGTLFGALADAAVEAGVFPHTVHCSRGDDGYRLQASCDPGPAPVTMEGLVRILRSAA